MGLQRIGHDWSDLTHTTLKLYRKAKTYIKRPRTTKVLKRKNKVDGRTPPTGKLTTNLKNQTNALLAEGQTCRSMEKNWNSKTKSVHSRPINFLQKYQESLFFVSVYFLGGGRRTAWHAGSYFPEQGSSPRPWKGGCAVLTTRPAGVSGGTVLCPLGWATAPSYSIKI